MYFKITKDSIYGISGWFLATLFGIFLGLTCGSETVIVESEKAVIERTSLIVKNQHPTDSVLVYLTLNAGKMYVSDVNGIFGITSTKKTQGCFYLDAGDSVCYTSPKGKAFNGNISFWNAPVNCPYAGTTLYEFNLNNYLTDKYAQETVDISCLAGVTSFGSIDLKGGSLNWTDNVNPQNITHIQNDSLYKNTGISGVYPYGCTNCTNTDGAPVCDNNPPPFATPNTENICNVQRFAKGSGGTVTISYISKN